MHRTFSLTCVALGLATISCGGATSIGEAGSTESGGTGGTRNNATGGTGGSGGSVGTESGGTGGGGGTVGTGGGGGTVGTGGGGGTVGTGGGGGTVGTESGGSGDSVGTESGGASSGTGAVGSGDTGGTTGGPAELPCDVLELAGQTCVAAHSTVRALVSDFEGNLYQVQRADGATQDIGVVDGLADAEAQEAFCADDCVVTILYDQSRHGNHLTPAPPGSADPNPGNPAGIGDLPTRINGRDVYGLLFRPGEGYRAACSECPYPPSGVSGAPVGDEPQTVYMVTSEHDLIDGCCFDYGNGEINSSNDGNGTVEAVYFGQGVIWGSGSGEGPWVMADLENGLFAGWEFEQDHNISTNLPLHHDFVSAVLVGDTYEKNHGYGRFALYGGDATSGELQTMYDGIRPRKPGYVPMQKQGSIMLSIAGDNSNGDGGRFYEGVIASGAATEATVHALQAAIVAAGYGR